MAKEFNVRDKVFIPAKITAVIGGGHYKAEFFVSNDEVKTESFNANVGTLFTAKQVSDKYIDGPTYDDLKTERDTLKMMLAERDRLLASANADVDNLRGQIGKLTTSIQNLTSDVNFYKTEHDKWLNTAQDNAKLVDALQEENKKLKQEFKDAEGAYDVVEETSIKRKKRITTMEEVIDALVEKIRRLQGEG